MDGRQVEQFEAERPRLVRLATRILGDGHAAEDVVQQAWLRWDRQSQRIENVPGWLTTVTSRLCLDQLRLRVPEPVESVRTSETGADPADEIALADAVGLALQVVMDRLTPGERVAFVLHDTFGFDFPTIAAMLDVSPPAARKLASRARAKVAPAPSEDALADWEVVDAFLAAAREGEFDRLLDLLAPDVVVDADAAALALGTPTRMEGADQVATFFDGAARTAFPVDVEGRPGAAWIHRGEAKVVFDFTIADGRVSRLTFRAEQSVLEAVRRRDGARARS